MKDYKALPELTRRLFTTHRAIVSDSSVRVSPHKLEELNWLREAYSDSLRMVLQERLCNLHPNCVVPVLTREDALRFARKRHDGHQCEWDYDQILGWVLGARAPVPAGAVRWGVRRLALGVDGGYWHGDNKDDLGWNSAEPTIPPFKSQDEAILFVNSMTKQTMLTYELYSKEIK